MSIITKYDGTLELKDIGSFAVAKEQIDDKVVYLATCFIGNNPVPTQEVVPKKIFRKMRKMVAPYVVDKAVTEMVGVTKHADVGDKDPADQD